MNKQPSSNYRLSYVRRICFQVAVISLLAPSIPCPANAQSSQPSFDCTQAGDRPDIVAICHDEKLAELDRTANNAYLQLRVKFGKKRANQITAPFMRARQQCGDDKSCIASSQITAISAFKSYGIAVDIPSVDGSNNVTADQQKLPPTVQSDSQFNPLNEDSAKRSEFKFSDFHVSFTPSAQKLVLPILAKGQSKIMVPASSFRQKMLECAKNRINFAGHFTTCVFGAGTETLANYMIDRVSGQVTEMPISAFGSMTFADSNLFVANPFIFDDGGFPIFREYYVWNGHTFESLGKDQKPNTQFILLEPPLVEIKTQLFKKEKGETVTSGQDSTEIHPDRVAAVRAILSQTPSGPSSPAAPAQVDEHIYYGSRAGMQLTTVSKEGIGSAHAVIWLKHTPNDAKAFCVEYEQDNSMACVERTMAEVKVADHVSANCINLIWTDMYGKTYEFIGPAKKSDSISAEYSIVNAKTDKILDGTSASGYGVQLTIFQQLCPGIAK